MQATDCLVENNPEGLYFSRTKNTHRKKRGSPTEGEVMIDRELKLFFFFVHNMKVFFLRINYEICAKELKH